MMLPFRCENIITHRMQGVLLLYHYAQCMNRLQKAKIVQIVEYLFLLPTQIRNSMIRFHRHSDEENFLFPLLHYVLIVVNKEDCLFVMKESSIAEIAMQVVNKLFLYILPINHIRCMIIKYGEAINGTHQIMVRTMIILDHFLGSLMN